MASGPYQDGPRKADQGFAADALLNSNALLGVRFTVDFLPLNSLEIGRVTVMGAERSSRQDTAMGKLCKDWIICDGFFSSTGRFVHRSI